MNNKKIISEDFEEEKKDFTSKTNDDNKTKKKSNAQKLIPFLTVVIVSLLVILVCVLIAYYQVYNSSEQNANILEGVYASSYYSMVDNVNNLSVDISKFSNLSTTQAKINTLSDMMLDCNYILAGLSILPINEENVVSATKFFNQVNGLCENYSNILSQGKTLTIEQELMFDKIGLVVGKIKSNFNEQNYGMYDSNYNFTDAGFFDDSGMNELSAGMGDLTSPNIEYPSMIFDGPFSSALEIRQVRGLKGEEISIEDAKNYLENVVYKDKQNVEISFEKETNSTIDTYDFNVNINKKDYSVQVSKIGGLVITISSYAESGDPIINKEKAIEISEDFANIIGFENMKSVWVEINKNVAYINLAPVVNDVIMYPDLVKVKVDLTSQQIIGFEALNYAYNHIDREFDFVLSLTEAEEKLGFDYIIISTSKAIIRLDSGKEISCYEFYVERIDGFYYYYIDSNTGEISKTMKLVKIQDVEKLI